jgi:hypothetical protein
MPQRPMTLIHLSFLAVILLSGCVSSKVQQLTITSKTHHIDRTYMSMTGPVDNQQVILLENHPRELIWLKEAQVEIIDPQTNKKKSIEHLCHSHLRFKGMKPFTLIQGRTHIQFPKGFGFPLHSDRPYTFHSMVINHNPVKEPFPIAVRTTFKYMQDKDLKEPMKPLFRTCLTLRVPISDEDKKKLDCLCNKPGSEDNEIDSMTTAAPIETTPGNVFKNAKGAQTSYHWLVPPGRHRYSSVFTGLEVPYDTSLHHMSIHLHAYGTYCQLKDLTTGKHLFKSHAKNYKDRIGIEKSEAYSSSQGIPVYKDHKYQVVCEYNNTTSKPIDAMGVLYLYFHNKKFDRKEFLSQT